MFTQIIFYTKFNCVNIDIIGFFVNRYTLNLFLKDFIKKKIKY